ncbi:MAG: hypothetical protein N7Q72_04580, partial [Spiroplasma sp. Tabriz.8]|nr:hypothetical protein [Spiroplasma sp. Tabriz.8]
MSIVKVWCNVIIFFSESHYLLFIIIIIIIIIIIWFIIIYQFSLKIKNIMSIQMFNLIRRKNKFSIASSLTP